MLSHASKKEYYQALLEKNTKYEGVFFVGVKTTGVFCRPSCPARKPKFEHCEFFTTAQETLLASYRPCKRCMPLSPPHSVSKLVELLVKAVEKNPEKKWKDRDFEKICIDAKTARRQFKKRFGMTFVAYARSRRMGIAMKLIRKGASVLEAQLSTGYESESGFRDAFSRIMGSAPSKVKEGAILKASWLDTPLGPMLAISDEMALYLLEFVDRRGLEREIEMLRKKTQCVIIPGSSDPIRHIEKELALYFQGKLKIFTTQICFLGTPFQKLVWEELRKIPFGETRSYADLAASMGNFRAYRAVARANGANGLSLIVPCHRVVNANGDLGGYGGGVARKKWLISHEKEVT